MTVATEGTEVLATENTEITKVPLPLVPTDSAGMKSRLSVPGALGHKKLSGIRAPEGHR